MIDVGLMVAGYGGYCGVFFSPVYIFVFLTLSYVLKEKYPQYHASPAGRNLPACDLGMAVGAGLAQLQAVDDLVAMLA